MRSFLDRHRPQTGKPDLRGFEWFHFWRLAYSRVAEFEWSGPHIAFSPDGKKLWMAGQAVDPSGATWKRHRTDAFEAIDTPGGRDVAVSPDGQQVVVANYNEAATIHDTATFREVAQIPFTIGGAVGEYSRSIMSYSPDGSILAFIAIDPPGMNTGSLRAVVKLWDVKTGRERTTLQDSQMTNSLAFSPDGKTLVTSHATGPLRLWNVETARKIEDWPLNQNQTRRVIARFSPDGKWLAEASLGVTALWDVAKRTAVFSQSFSRINDLAFSPDSRLLALAVGNREVAVLEVPTGQRVGVMRGFGKSVNAVAFSPDGRFLAAGSYDARVAAWDVDSILAQRMQPELQSFSIVFSAKGQFLLTGEGGATLRNASTQAKIQSLPGRSASNGVAISGDGSVLSLADMSGLLRVFRTGGDDPIFSHRTTRSRMIVMDSRGERLGTFGAVSPSGEYVVTALDSGAAGVFQLPSKRQVAVLGKPGSGTYGAQFSPDGTLVAITGFQAVNVGSPDAMAEMSLWDTRTWRRRFDLRRPGKEEWYSHYLAFSPDGLRLAGFDSDNDVVIWDTRTGQRIQTLAGAKGSARCLAISPDNRRVIACDDGDIIFWDLVNGQAVNIRHPFRINGAAFAPDGKTLAAIDSAGRTLYLDATPPAVLPPLVNK